MTSIVPFAFLVRLRRCAALLAGLVIVLFAKATPLSSEEWPAWRGPSANGSVHTKGAFPVKWAPGDAEWKLALPGKGGSTPIVWKGVVYLTTPADEEDAVMAIELKSGRVLWTTKLGAASPPKHRRLGSSCNSSPVTDGKAVFVYFRSGRFAALELNGDVRWSRDLAAEFGPENLYWDQGSSPVATDDAVILTRLHAGESWIASFGKSNGEIQWRKLRNYKTPPENDNGYTTPLLFSAGGAPAALVWGADHLTAYDRSSGSLLWALDGFNGDGTGFWPAIASPVIIGDMAVIPVGRDDRAGQASIHGVRLNPDGAGPGARRIWTRDDVGVFVPALAEYEGRVYLLRNRGGVACLNPATGESHWEGAFPRERYSYYSSPVIANGLLYAAREDGAVFVAQVGQTFKALAENAMNERIVASPVPISNRLLLRGDKHLFCIAPAP